MPVRPIHDEAENSLLVSQRELQLEEAGLDMLKPIRAFENRHQLYMSGSSNFFSSDEAGDELPKFAPQDENLKFIAGSWEEHGKSFHQFVARPLLCPDEVREALEWCEVHGKTLVNKRGLNGLATKLFWQGRHMDVVMIFTDLNEATHARLRWG